MHSIAWSRLRLIRWSDEKGRATAAPPYDLEYVLLSTTFELLPARNNANQTGAKEK
jgi:hypothetical protein